MKCNKWIEKFRNTRMNVEIENHSQLKTTKCDHMETSCSCEFSNGILILNCGCQWCFPHFDLQKKIWVNNWDVYCERHDKYVYVVEKIGSMNK